MHTSFKTIIIKHIHTAKYLTTSKKMPKFLLQTPTLAVKRSSLLPSEKYPDIFIPYL